MYSFDTLTRTEMEALLAVNKPIKVVEEKPLYTLAEHLYLVVGIPACYHFYERKGA